MKTSAGILLCLIGLVSHTVSEPASKLRAGARHKAAEPRYFSESPLPEGWPEPGPFNQVTLKKYPAYRAAFTRGNKPDGEFMTLFRHIKRHDIPMTAPVEMKLDADAKEAADMEQMAFLYQNQKVGKTGADGEDVEVRDVAAAEALSYAWQGPRSMAGKAREALDAELAKLGRKAKEYRLLGYNSPFIPRARQTHELQAVLE
ncbi:MAG TPA: heme-binding protein [Luteolibacter sp.]|nr:heme-binding protein [Luteolibacter sp.]